MAEYSGFSTTIAYGDGAATEAFTSVGQVRDISGPSYEANAIDVSHRGSTTRAFVAGMIDAGEVTFDVVFDPDLATHGATGLRSFIGTKKNWRISLPDTSPTLITFSAVMTGFELASPMEDAISANITLKVAGTVTWA